MSTALEQPTRYVNPTTGEVLTLASSPNELGCLIDDLREYKRAIDAAIKEVSAELLSRFDKAAKWTWHAGEGVTLTAPSPRPQEEFDAPALFEALTDLVREGVLTHTAVHSAVSTQITYKVHRSGINALRALGGGVKAAVDAHASEVEKDRRVSVVRNA